MIIVEKVVNKGDLIKFRDNRRRVLKMVGIRSTSPGLKKFIKIVGIDFWKNLTLDERFVESYYPGAIHIPITTEDANFLKSALKRFIVDRGTSLSTYLIDKDLKVEVGYKDFYFSKLKDKPVLIMSRFDFGMFDEPPQDDSDIHPERIGAGPF